MLMFKRDTDCNSYSLLGLYVVCVTESCGFIKSTKQCSFSFYFGEIFEEYWHWLFIESLVEFCGKTTRL